MGRKILISFDLDNPVDTKTIMELISKHVSEMQSQQKLSVESRNKDGEEKFSVFEPATLKQQALMDKLKIVWDNHTSKEQASSLITERMNEKRGKG